MNALLPTAPGPHSPATPRTTGRLSRGWLGLLGLAFAFALTACTHIQLVGDYDEAIDQGVTSIQRKAEAYFAHFDSAPTSAYGQAFYDDIDVDLAVLTTRAQATPKYGIIEKQLAEMKASFQDLRQLDRITPRPITKDTQGRSPFSAGLSTIEQQARHILTLELALKRGEDGASAGK